MARLGFKRLHQTITMDDRPEILGMIRKVDYMLRVEHVCSEESPSDQLEAKPEQEPMVEEKTPERSTEKEENGDA